ncbi:MAG: 4-hydroxy-tetrahydrodipicolinate synthase [Candidatus Omnitrophica bacterium]|nr:4-hydroxy-tetrahydrodipicolinate synthase [Candidatus Omnitrophota bacterium]MBU1127727.1 4-hydroxy-tetrahydrodipicolinate synthase [Candidatus Omnitrophota bacterium]MBU1656757.1 4-hydroxy-tetrahydrodipicolinate synthase [Candidatus Omnitrophota bacterium]MBU1784291.1 4-hydroxy-tetrahydrodipicolinate synthase [Candidatus Omnitrophota bacterium]MBU1852277.1 4-hydroxy-tetrahydrodipicolinate synthase [Candidatus Omnitrophota bacterium]
MFKGSYVALVTPFKKGKIDDETFRKLIEFHIEQGTEGLVPCGCTGEAATLDTEEQKRLIELAVETCSGRIPVVAGTGSNSTKEAIDLTVFAARAGCDGALIITPYYNKPTPEGQYRHYAEIASKADIPIMLYNVPGRTGISMLPSTIARLSKVDNIVAIKEAAGSVQQVVDILSLCDITVLSGDDSMTLPFMCVGAKGVVSVAANIIPAKIRELVQTFANGDIEASRKIHYEIVYLCEAMFIETNPIPVKTALSMMGMVDGEFRMPLCEMMSGNKAKLEEMIRKHGLI